MLSNGAAFINTQSRSSLRSYVNSSHYRRTISSISESCDYIVCDYERDIALLFSELRPFVLNAALSESRRWRFTTDYKTDFTDMMRMTIAFD